MRAPMPGSSARFVTSSAISPELFGGFLGPDPRSLAVPFCAITCASCSTTREISLRNDPAQAFRVDSILKSEPRVIGFRETVGAPHPVSGHLGFLAPDTLLFLQARDRSHCGSADAETTRVALSNIQSISIIEPHTLMNASLVLGFWAGVVGLYLYAWSRASRRSNWWI